MSAEQRRDPDVRILDFADREERDAHEGFYLTIIETNPGKIDLNLDPGHDFDTREEAEAYLHAESAEWGVGGHVYQCVRVAGLSMADDEPPEGDPSESASDGGAAV